MRVDSRPDRMILLPGGYFVLHRVLGADVEREGYRRLVTHDLGVSSNHNLVGGEPRVTADLPAGLKERVEELGTPMSPHGPYCPGPRSSCCDGR